MALVLIEKDDEHYNVWSGGNLEITKLGSYNVKSCIGIFIFVQPHISLKDLYFWETLGEKIPEENINVYIHFGGGDEGKIGIPGINKILESAKLHKRIKVSYYSLGSDEPNGIADIYHSCEPKKEFNAKGLLDIFAIKSVAEKKIKAEKKIENQQLYITALMLLLKVNQTSLQASSKLLADLKDGLSAMKKPGIDTSDLVNCLGKISLNGVLSETDIKEMENDCREILKILKNERQSLGIENQNIS